MILTNERLLCVSIANMSDTLDFAHGSLDTFGVPVIVPFPKPFPGKRDAVSLSEIQAVTARQKNEFDIEFSDAATTCFAVGRKSINAGQWSKRNQELRDRVVRELRAATY